MRLAIALGTILLVGRSAVLLASPPQDPLPIPDLGRFDPEVAVVVRRAHARTVMAPSSAEAAGGLGMVLQSHGQPEAARTAYERAIELDPTVFKWHYFLAVVLERLTELDSASSRIASALEMRPDYLPARFLRANLLYELGDFAASGAEYQRILHDRATSPRALYGLARVRHAENALQEASTLYLNATRQDDDFGPAYYGLAQVSLRLGLQEEARRYAELARSRSSRGPRPADPLLDELAGIATGVHNRLEHARWLADAGRFEEAVELYEEQLERKPTQLTALVNLMRIETILGRYGKVEALYASAQAVHDDVPEVHRVFAQALMTQSRFSEARTPLLRALHLNPAFADALTLFGGVLEIEGQPTAALGYYRHALAAQSTHRAARFFLGQLLLGLGKPDEALPELLRVIDEDSLDLQVPTMTIEGMTVQAMVLAAAAYRQLDRPEEARLQLAAAREAAVERKTPQLLPRIDAEPRRLPGDDRRY